MITKFLTVLIAISISANIAFAQTGFSESKPYEPKGDAKLGKRVTPVPAAAAQEIVIPVSVLDEWGAPITDLTKANFSVLIDGAESPLTAFEKAVELPNIILLLDMSPSAQLQIEAIRDQATRFVPHSRLRQRSWSLSSTRE